ncbi:MAG: GerMN domain-containing protein [Spirochaetia bacterium]|nr:GerMN domain-containing protein [Spirochaetia bacterium]
MKIENIKEKLTGIGNSGFFYSKKFRAATVGAAVLLFLIASVPFIVRSVTRQEFILLFPDKEGTELYREIRLAPRMDTPRERIGELLRQLIQGSMLLDPYPLFPYSTKVNQVVVSGEDIYIDLSSDAVKTQLPIERAVEIVKINIRNNFSGYDTITVTVNGHDPVVVNKSIEEKDLEQ